VLRLLLFLLLLLLLLLPGCQVVCEGRLYSRWLTRQLEEAGVHFVQRKLSSLAELAGEGWDVVCNCTGLGARALLPDQNSYPIRGQIMRVKAPWVNQCVFAHFSDETAYIIPNRWGHHKQWYEVYLTVCSGVLKVERAMQYATCMSQCYPSHPKSHLIIECYALMLHCCREWVVLGGTGQVGNGSTDMSLADAHKIADRAIQVM
jgi:hypothetical protein